MREFRHDQRLGYVTYDEIEDVLASTGLLASIIERLEKEPVFRKWAIVAAQKRIAGCHYMRAA